MVKPSEETIRSLEAKIDNDPRWRLNLDPPIHADLSRFTTSGHGTVRGSDAPGFTPGQMITVTDDDADCYQAEILSVTGETDQIRVRWDAALPR